MFVTAVGILLADFWVTLILPGVNPSASKRLVK
jgi:hypothetical protein